MKDIPPPVDLFSLKFSQPYRKDMRLIRTQQAAWYPKRQISKVAAVLLFTFLKCPQEGSV